MLEYNDIGAVHTFQGVNFRSLDHQGPLTHPPAARQLVYTWILDTRACVHSSGPITLQCAHIERSLRMIPVDVHLEQAWPTVPPLYARMPLRCVSLFLLLHVQLSRLCR